MKTEYYHPQVWYFDCYCYTHSHVMRFQFDKNEDDMAEMLYVTFYLDPNRPWYKRVWTALQYIFRREHDRHRPGDYDTWVLSIADVKRLRKMADDTINEIISRREKGKP